MEIDTKLIVKGSKELDKSIQKDLDIQDPDDIIFDSDFNELVDKLGLDAAIAEMRKRKCKLSPD